MHPWPDNVLTAPPAQLRTDVAVIGSGPGGSITACLLAEAGRNTLILEDGPMLRPESCPEFSREEMIQKYRNGGLTIAMGRAKVSYVEGRCVGGGSEVNSGLYHRTPPAILLEWQRDFRVEALTEADLLPHFEASERDMSVSLLPGPAPAASLKLRDGAERLGWSAVEVPRWFAYAPTPTDPTAGAKQTMTRTFVPRALAAGATLVPEMRADRLIRRGNQWVIKAWHAPASGPRRKIEVISDRVVVAAGAIQTPALLRRSRISRLAGRTLHMHPTNKVVAVFPEPVNHLNMGVPVHQVKQFAPRYSFGCSISAPPYVALAMLDHPAHAAAVAANWQHAVVYYAMTRGGCGSVRNVPGFRDPLVRFHLTSADLVELADALRDLCRCLFAAGATAIYPTIRGSVPLTCEADLASLPQALPPDRSSLMTIHLFSSCPMGEDRTRCVTDSFGRVNGAENLCVADASLLCGPPGVNPQGSVMAIVRRNVAEMLTKSG